MPAWRWWRARATCAVLGHREVLHRGAPMPLDHPGPRRPPVGASCLRCGRAVRLLR